MAATFAVLAAGCAPAAFTAAGQPVAGPPGQRGATIRTGVADGAAAALFASTRADQQEADRIEPTVTPVKAVLATAGFVGYVSRRPERARVVSGVASRARSVPLTPPVAVGLGRPGAVALTFDDGPDPAWTPKVLALLRQYRVPAVFCLIGESAAAYPGLVQDIVAAGDVTCDHTWDHDELLATQPLARIRTEIGRARRAIIAAGAVPMFFRAPGGDWSPLVEAEARRQHLVPLHWTVDPRDWSRPGTGAIVAAVRTQLRGGGIILLHDGGGDRSQTLAALTILLRTLPAMGYHFVLPSTH